MPTTPTNRIEIISPILPLLRLRGVVDAPLDVRWIENVFAVGDGVAIYHRGGVLMMNGVDAQEARRLVDDRRAFLARHEAANAETAVAETVRPSGAPPLAEETFPGVGRVVALPDDCFEEVRRAALLSLSNLADDEDDDGGVFDAL